MLQANGRASGAAATSGERTSAGASNGQAAASSAAGEGPKSHVERFVVAWNAEAKQKTASPMVKDEHGAAGLLEAYARDKAAGNPDSINRCARTRSKQSNGMLQQ